MDKYLAMFEVWHNLEDRVRDLYQRVSYSTVEDALDGCLVVRAVVIVTIVEED